MVKKRSAKTTRSTQLLQFISSNPGLSAEEISKSLGWTSRSVRLVLGRLERTSQISSRYFPVVAPEVKDDYLGIEREISSGKSKLEKMLHNLRERDRETFEKCVKAQMARDENLASMYANQCVEIRKLMNTVIASENVLSRMSLALENLRLRRKIF